MRYRYLDFAVDSDLSLPELEPWRQGTVRVVLQRSLNPPAPDVWSRSVMDDLGHAWLRIGRAIPGYVLDFPDRLRVLYSEGHLGWAASETLASDTLRHLVLDQVLPLVAAHEGYTVLHAACAVRAEAAVLIAGAAGEGKSTLVASLVANGWSWASDDAVALRVQGDAVTARPGYGGVRLWPDASRALGFGNGQSVSSGSNKRRFAPTTLPDRDVFVSALYVVASADSGEAPAIERLSARDGMMALVRNAYVLDESDSGRAAARFEALAAVAERLGVQRITIPHRFQVLDELRAWIERGSPVRAR